MKLISINARKVLGDYFNDSLLCGGLLLSGTLLAIYCLVGGTVRLITTVCVLILGLVLGIAIRRYLPYKISSCINGTIPLTSSIKSPLTQPAW